jgi:hypothetical protein
MCWGCRKRYISCSTRQRLELRLMLTRHELHLRIEIPDCCDEMLTTVYQDTCIMLLLSNLGYMSTSVQASKQVSVPVWC